MDKLVLAGKLGKLHGIKSYITIHLDCEVDWDNINAIFIEMNGMPVPYLIEDIKFLPQKTIVKFQRLYDMQELSKMVNKNIFIEKKLIIDEEDENLKDFIVIDINHNHFEIGVVDGIHHYSNSKWLIVKNKNAHEILLPAHDELIESIDYSRKIIYYKAIDGMY